MYASRTAASRRRASSKIARRRQCLSDAALIGRSSSLHPRTSTTPVAYTATGTTVAERQMSYPRSSRITTLLGAMRQGDDAARDEFVTLVYPELRRIAAHYMRQERPHHTLQTTALVNEMYVRLLGTTRLSWQSRA